MSDLEIGATLSDTFRVCLQSLARLSLVVLLIGIPCVLLGAGFFAAREDGFEFDPDSPDPTFLILVYAILIPASTLFNSIVIQDAYHRLIGRPLSFGRAIGEGVRKVPRLFLIFVLIFGIYILSVIPVGMAAGVMGAVDGGSGILMVLGVILFMIAWMVGLMAAACIWFPILPVAIVEKRLVSSFGRSARLTKGNRFSILALMLVVGMAAGGIYLVFAVVVMAGSAVFQGLGASLAIEVIMGVIAGVLYLALLTGMTSVQMILPTAVYHHLKRSKEGGDEDQLAEVFR